MRSTTWLALLLLTAGCGGDTTHKKSDAGGSGGQGGASSCPSAPPDSGDRCMPRASTFPGQTVADCSWGTDPRPACRTTAVCQENGTWLLKEGDDVLCTRPPLPPECPATPAVAGSACDDPTLACHYQDGTRCWCSPCRGGSEYPVCQTIDPPEWACTPLREDCPRELPNGGAACSVPGASCGPDCENEVVCEDGAWRWRAGMCPVCAAPDTPIATPAGERALSDLRPGDLVFSVHDGAVVVVPILRTGSTAVRGHHVVRVTLTSGAVLEMSAGHPTGQGVQFGDLEPKDAFDDLLGVRAVEVVPYRHDRTYDILPDSSTGTYFAGGAWVGSTLVQQGGGRSSSLGSASSAVLPHP